MKNIAGRGIKAKCSFCNERAKYDAPMPGHSTWAYFCVFCAIEYELNLAQELGSVLYGDD
jgi:hypothetical protein